MGVAVFISRAPHVLLWPLFRPPLRSSGLHIACPARAACLLRAHSLLPHGCVPATCCDLLLRWRLLLLLCRTVATRGTWCFRCDPPSVPLGTMSGLPPPVSSRPLPPHIRPQPPAFSRLPRRPARLRSSSLTSQYQHQTF
jgi:hypothetical protein